MQTSDSDEVWSKVVALVEKFPTVCHTPLTRKEIGAILDFLMIGNQIGNLTPYPSFGHNLCLKCPNGGGLLWSLSFVEVFLKKIAMRMGNSCRTPTLAKCGGEAQHLEKSGVGVLRDSRMFRARQKGAKHLSLGCSWCHWKGLEA
jgi:hypothetical protein